MRTWNNNRLSPKARRLHRARLNLIAVSALWAILLGAVLYITAQERGWWGGAQEAPSARTLPASPFSCMVTYVYDGDTVACEDADGESWDIRLMNIDAPEKTQTGGMLSTQALTDLVHGEIIGVGHKGYDDYNRVLGQVSVKGTWINHAMVRNGWALATSYGDNNFDHYMYEVQEAAMEDGIGLWAMQYWQQRDFCTPYSFRQERCK